MNKNAVKRRKYLLSRSSNQYPWNLSKLKTSLKKRKWFRIKFSENLLKSRKFFRYKQLTTYENKTKSLFRKFFAPGVTNTQFKKLFKFKNRYRSTFRKVLKLEHRFDTLVYRLYMIQNVHIARFCITNNFFKVNNLIKSEPGIIIKPGDIIELSNKKIWNIFYSNILKIISSIKKYYNRILFKMSYSFIPTRKHRLFKEDGWKKKKSIRFLLKRFKLKIKFWIRKSKYVIKRKTRKFLCSRKINKFYKTISYDNGNITKTLLKFNPKRPYKKRKPAYLMKKSYNIYNFINPIKIYLKKKRFIKKKIDTRYKKKSQFVKKKLSLIKLKKVNSLNLNKVRPFLKLNKKLKSNKKFNIQVSSIKTKKIIKLPGLNPNYQTQLYSEISYKLYKKSLLKKNLLYSFLFFYKKSKKLKKKRALIYKLRNINFFKFFYSKEFIKLKNSNKFNSVEFRLKFDSFFKTEKFKKLKRNRLVYKNLSHFHKFKQVFKYKKNVTKENHKVLIKNILTFSFNKNKVSFVKSPMFYKLFKNYQTKFGGLSNILLSTRFFFAGYKKNIFKLKKLSITNLKIKNKLKKSNFNLKKKFKILLKVKNIKTINNKFQNNKKNYKLRQKQKKNKNNSKLSQKQKKNKNSSKLSQKQKNNKFKTKFKFTRKRPYWWKRNWVHFYWQHKRISKKFFIFNEFRKKFNNSFRLFKLYKNKKLVKTVSVDKGLIKVLPYLYLKKINKLKNFNHLKNKGLGSFSKFSKVNKDFLKHFLNVSLISAGFIRIIIMLNSYIISLDIHKKGILVNNFINNILKQKKLGNKKIKRYIIFLILMDINLYELLKFKNILNKKAQVSKISTYKNKHIETLCKTKRKFLLIKSLFRKFNNNRIEVILKNNIYKPIQIKYKKVNLNIKYRPFPVYYIEINYNTLSFSITSEFDFLHYPYRTLLDFNSISYFYSR